MERNLWIRNLAIAVTLWTSGSLLGFGFATHARSNEHNQRQPIAAIEEANEPSVPAAPIKQASPVGKDLYFGILGRNLSVYAWLLCGLVSLGISTVVVTLFNGIYLGQTLGIASASGAEARSMAWLLLPHGILEVSAFLLAAAVGILGLRLARVWLTKPTLLPVEMRGVVRLWPVAALGAAALVVAAGIETFVTVPLAQSQGATP